MELKISWKIYLCSRLGEDAKKKIEIIIGQSKIQSQLNAKLLGMKFQNDLNLTEHIHGKGGVISALNQRLFLIKRLNNSLEKKALVKVDESIFNSKIRYGLQWLGQVRLSNSESQQQDLLAIQRVQNKMIRFLNNKDRMNTCTYLGLIHAHTSRTDLGMCTYQILWGICSIQFWPRAYQISYISLWS